MSPCGLFRLGSFDGFLYFTMDAPCRIRFAVIRSCVLAMELIRCHLFASFFPNAADPETNGCQCRPVDGARIRHLKQ